MTTNSPNPVDGDVQALTEKERIKQVEVVSSLIEKIVSDCANGWTAERDYLLPLKIALAALTADIAGPFDCVFIGAGVWASITDELPDRFEGKKVYVSTAPPAQLLRPVELPGYVDDLHGIGPVMSADAVVETLRQQGYEVKS